MDFGQETDKYRGLTNLEAEERLKIAGLNELPRESHGLFRILKKILQEPMFILLLTSGVLYLLIGERQDALILLGFILVTISLTIYQEKKTEKALEALRRLASPKALVIRDGKYIQILGRELVIGDILIIKEGDRIPADAVILETSNLSVDESVLTGESFAVNKIPWDFESKPRPPGGNNTPYVYSGTLVAAGTAISRVIATGTNTYFGNIGKSLETIREETTPLQAETGRLIKIFGILGGVLSVSIILIYGLIANQWLGGILSGLTFAMALIPEEFPMVLIIFLTLGAWRISRKKVLTRTTSAIEALGATTVLCVDKTGTITQNKMSLELMRFEELIYSPGKKNFPQIFNNLLSTAILASRRNPFDPMEKAIWEKIPELSPVGQQNLKKPEFAKEYPFSSKLQASSYIWRIPGKQELAYFAATKGTPETIAELCHFTSKQRLRLLSQVEEMSKSGARVIAVARSEPLDALPEGSISGVNFKYCGLLGFRDPVRDNVSIAVNECYTAGIRIIIISGDYPATVQYAAKKIGLKNPDNFITGPELEKISDETLHETIKSINIFARILPEQKLRLVRSLKELGEIVAMTGDGVNDAPALKSAQIGIAMGLRGTDVAREASDLVLENDDFYSIVQAIRQGRLIFDNLRKAIAYIVSVHIPIAGLSIIPLILGLPPLLFPEHVAFLELIIDPSCSTVFESEPEDSDIMHRPPRQLNQPLFNKRLIGSSLIQGMSVLLVVLVVYFYALYTGTDGRARAMGFSVMVFGNLALLTIDLAGSKSFGKFLYRPNKLLLIIIILAVTFLLLSVNIPLLQEIFHFLPLEFREILLVLSLPVLAVSWYPLLYRNFDNFSPFFLNKITPFTRDFYKSLKRHFDKNIH